MSLPTLDFQAGIVLLHQQEAVQQAATTVARNVIGTGKCVIQFLLQSTRSSYLFCARLFSYHDASF